MHIDNTAYPVTPESIQRAKADRDAERAVVYRQTGIRVTDDETILPASYPPRLVVVQCPRCLFVAARASQELAVRAVWTHHTLRHGLALVPHEIKEQR